MKGDLYIYICLKSGLNIERGIGYLFIYLFILNKGIGYFVNGKMNQL